MDSTGSPRAVKAENIVSKSSRTGFYWKARGPFLPLNLKKKRVILLKFGVIHQKKTYNFLMPKGGGIKITGSSSSSREGIKTPLKIDGGVWTPLQRFSAFPVKP